MYVLAKQPTVHCGGVESVRSVINEATLSSFKKRAFTVSSKIKVLHLFCERSIIRVTHPIILEWLADIGVPRSGRQVIDMLLSLLKR